MGIFDQGQATQTAIPGALAPADIASRLFAIKLLLARLAQSGGAPQTLGEYIKSGPRKLDQGTISDASSGLMQALSQPGAFTKGPTVTKTKPSSPSLFQEGASGLSLLMMLNALTGGGKPEGLSIQDQLLARALGVDPTTLKQPTQTPSLLSRIFGGGDAATTGQLGGITQYPTLGPSDQIGMTMDPTYSTPVADYSSGDGMSFDTSYLSSLLG